MGLSQTDMQNKKKLKERSANKRAIDIKAIPNHDTLIYSAQDQKVPAHKVNL